MSKLDRYFYMYISDNHAYYKIFLILPTNLSNHGPTKLIYRQKDKSNNPQMSIPDFLSMKYGYDWGLCPLKFKQSPHIHIYWFTSKEREQIKGVLFSIQHIGNKWENDNKKPCSFNYLWSVLRWSIRILQWTDICLPTRTSWLGDVHQIYLPKCTHNMN